ncbi:MAG: hypothetical protein ACKVQK_15565, partial [Burkholderiales bacterium]
VKKITNLGGELKDAADCFVTVTSDSSVGLQELAQIMNVLRTQTGDNCTIRQGHIYRKGVGAILSVDLMV